MVTAPRQRGQALVEFALVAPMIFLILLMVLDFGRGLLCNEMMANGAREAARQAVLRYNNRSNLSAPACSPCQVPGVMPLLTTMSPLGYGPPVFALSSSASSPPWYGTYQPGSAGMPGKSTLTTSAASNTMYVFIYELNPTTGAINWATCDPCSGVRSGGGQLVVVDLKIRWQPVVLKYAGLAPAITLDAQTVAREEW
jgi:Flp pilus assembly protein TadG